jgi:hypothetical protein
LARVVEWGPAVTPIRPITSRRALVLALGALALAVAGGRLATARPRPERSRRAREVPGQHHGLQRVHTPGAHAGKPDHVRLLAGSTIGFGLPGVGVVYPPNLTPDPETGLGRWTHEQIARAIRYVAPTAARSRR